ncbi:MAG: hypothetical protein ABSG31_15185, partial [Tepidisphaeraceae bacterium]
HEKPFRRFRIVLKNGERHNVDDRFWFAFRDDRLMVLPNGGVSKQMKFQDVDRVEVIKSKR